jgi:NAD(P)-dependent dehydrogenase (short-subunit alcohol dehydrogenase family)
MVCRRTCQPVWRQDQNERHSPRFFPYRTEQGLLTNEDGSYTERGNLVLGQTPFKRFGHTDELIGAMQWLLSDASKFVTGTVINVDGGFIVNSGV